MQCAPGFQDGSRGLLNELKKIGGNKMGQYYHPTMIDEEGNITWIYTHD